jgi:hypothetical protein
MALKLDNALLEELGLGRLPDSEKQLLLSQIYEKLEMNVGMRLADQMSNEQLDAFEKFVDANDDKGAFQWLEANFPNYKMVVNEEFEKLKAEINSVAPQILASAQQQAQQQQPAAGSLPLAASSAGSQQAQQYAPQQYQQPQPQPYTLAQPPASTVTPLTAPPHYNDQAQPSAYLPQQYQPAYQPAATPQAGHLQPQYGQPSQAPIQAPAVQFPNQGQPQSGIYPTPQYPPQQPPAGPAQ